MKERPILFSAPMVRAILAGTKSQTRRAIKFKPWHQLEQRDDDSYWPWMATDDDDHGHWLPCPFGAPGDRLWVRETCRAHEITDKEAETDAFDLGYEVPPYGLDGVVYLADGEFRAIENTPEASVRWLGLRDYGGKCGAVVPSIHMPRWASRITLEITGIRVERLEEISAEDARAEGCNTPHVPGSGTVLSRQAEFMLLWESINGPGSWDANPWVWVVEFKKAGGKG